MPGDFAAPRSRSFLLDPGLVVVRVMLGALFVLSGYAKATALARTTGYFAGLGLPLPTVTTWVVIAIEIGLPLLMLVGFRTRWVPLSLAVFTIGTAVIGHQFWTFDAATQAQQYAANITQFLKNVAIAGGLLLLALVGPGRIALDRDG